MEFSVFTTLKNNHIYSVERLRAPAMASQQEDSGCRILEYVGIKFGK